MPEVWFTVPATLLDHGSDDDVGSERTLVNRVILGYFRVLDRIIRRQTHHPAARGIDVNRFPVRVCYADKVRRVFEKRHKYLALILDSFALADVADESLPATVGQDVCTHLDGHERSILSNQRPIRSFHLSRCEKVSSDRLQPRRVLGRDDIENCLLD